ncbi:unnamed protein product, partial [Linum tenue]
YTSYSEKAMEGPSMVYSKAVVAVLLLFMIMLVLGLLSVPAVASRKLLEFVAIPDDQPHGGHYPGGG